MSVISARSTRHRNGRSGRGERKTASSASDDQGPMESRIERANYGRDKDVVVEGKIIRGGD